MSSIPMRLICKEIQQNTLRSLFSEAEVRRAAYQRETPEGLPFMSIIRGGDIWVSEFDWEQWRDQRLENLEEECHQMKMEEAENLQYRHAQKVAQRRREDSNG